MMVRLAPILTLFAVLVAHGALLSLVFLAPESKPLEIQQPTVQGMLVAAPPAEVVQAPAARETPPAPVKPEITPAPVQPKAEPPPEPAPKPQPKPKPAPKPQPPPVKAPPTERAISTPPEDRPAETPAEAPQEIAEAAEPAVESPPSSSVPAETADDTLGVPVVPPHVDAQRMQNPAPAYPRQSRRLREEGTVVLELLILEDGTVSKARIETSSGYSRLDETALQAVKHWRYMPATQGGKPIAFTYLQPVVFSLTD